MKYIRIEYKNVEPFRIIDNSKSQSGQADTLTYIPGSVFRGVVVNEASKEESFNDYLKALLSENVHFMNGYIVVSDANGTHELLPSVKGYYEDKTDSVGTKIIESSLLCERPTPGYKRAMLGEYCYFVNDTVVYTNINKGCDMKINIGKAKGEKKNVFRDQYINAGYTFISYISVKENNIAEYIMNILKRIKEEDSLFIGNSKSKGMGKCRINSIKLIDNYPYSDLAQVKGASQNVYMYLLSDIEMINEMGENVGIDIPSMEEILGVTELRIEKCSSSVRVVYGYNKQWGSRVPSEKMYEKGSIFKLSFSGEITTERINYIYENALGIRKNEGYGQVVFLDNYDKINKKLEIDETKTADNTKNTDYLSDEDKEVLRIAARSIYSKTLSTELSTCVVGKKSQIGKTNTGRIGTIRSFAESGRYNPIKAIESICSYVKHCEDKDAKTNQHNDSSKNKELLKTVRRIISTEAEEYLLGDKLEESTLGIKNSEILTPLEKQSLKLELLLSTFGIENRGGKNDNE